MDYPNFRRIPGTKLYRGSKLDDLDEKEKDKLEQEYGIKCVIDLRSPRECKRTKEPVVAFSESCFLFYLREGNVFNLVCPSFFPRDEGKGSLYRAPALAPLCARPLSWLVQTCSIWTSLYRAWSPRHVEVWLVVTRSKGNDIKICFSTNNQCWTGRMPHKFKGF